MKTVISASLFFAVTAFGADFTGVVSDAKCGAMHTKLTAADKECIAKCVNGGEQAVLLVGDKVYKIDNQDAIKANIGQKVTVTGTLKGDTLHADKVKVAG